MDHSSLDALEGYLRSYRAELLDEVVPFWQKHAEDAKNGGIFTCIDDHGAVISGDKWVWSQFRAVWVFAKLYNSFTDPHEHAEQRAEWLRFALAIYEFCCAHAYREDAGDGSGCGGWALCLSADGAELKGCESVYVDMFAVYGLAELYRATRRPDVLHWASKSADSLMARLAALDGATPPLDIAAFPYPIPKGQKVHGLPMMLSLVLWELGDALQEPRYRAEALRCADEVFSDFHDSDGSGLVVERVRRGPPGEPRAVAAPDGTAVVPGHVIECMWFMMHIARDRGGEASDARVALAARLVRRHLEAGWDEEHGGIFLAIDALGGDEIGWKFPDTKIWWPHTEALYALLLSYEATGEEWCLEWHKKVHEYTYAHFPLAGTGEWTQKLDREGKPLTEVVALPVKDPFHLPRALIYCVEVLERLVAKGKAKASSAARNASS